MCVQDHQVHVGLFVGGPFDGRRVEVVAAAEQLIPFEGNAYRYWRQGIDRYVYSGVLYEQAAAGPNAR